VSVCVSVCLSHTGVVSKQLNLGHTHTTTLSGTTRVSQHRKGKTSLDLLEQVILSGSGISWAYVNLHLASDR